MNLSKNVCYNAVFREIKEKSSIAYQRRHHVTTDFVRRIGLEAELEGHTGCVNCLEWNENGSLLASGSDDVQIIIWDPFKHKQLHTIRTGHTGNIFSVKFLPKSNDSIVVSGAADARIRVHDVNTGETTQMFSCHAGRVKRLATAPNLPFMFWSAAEDGTVMQFDLRSPELACSSHPKNVLLNLNAYVGPSAELKCLSVNPVRPELLAIGSNDPYVRMYDRRMLNCRSIKFPTSATGVVRSPWERENLLEMMTKEEDFSIHPKAAQYFVPGHLPQKHQEYKRKYRTLAATYLNFSQDGNELLVNLGGEQIYLFDINARRKPQKYDISGFLPPSNGLVKGAVAPSSNGLHPPNGTTNGVTNGHVVSHAARGAADDKPRPARSRRSKSAHKPLPHYVEAIKQQANAVYDHQKYNEAIMLYNQAISLAPHSPVLYGNRAAAFMKRNWDGDLYAALRDCYSAMMIDSTHLKAHFRLAKCLFELSWTAEASECLQIFKSKFPDYAQSQACLHLERDIQSAIDSKSTAREGLESERAKKKPREADVCAQERAWRADSMDYEHRFCGHCNTTTDIKEANFFGSNGQFIVAGSDDGSFFIWDRSTTNIVRVLRGDDSIVNCLQPHPSYCLLATSGIDPVVRLWSPKPEDGQKDEREVDDSHDAAAANQRRMNADPLEVMLMNMGYSRIAGVFDSSEDSEEREGEGGSNVACRPS